MLRLLGLNQINFLVKRSLVLLALLGSVFLIFNSPSNVYAEDSSASLTVTGNFNIDLTPQGTEQIMLRASGMQATAKTTSVAGYSLYVSGGDENGNFVNEKASNSILKPINGSAYYSFAADQINIWGFCGQYYGSTTQCDSNYFQIGKPSAPTLLKKSDTATPTDGFTYKANLFARANQQIVSGKYIGDITYSLIVNEEISSTLVTGREFNKLLREAVNTTDPTILNDPKSELPVYINSLTFAKTEPTATSKKTVKISTENSEEPVYLTAVQSSTNSYALTIWSNVHHIYTNADSSYMFSGLNSVSTGLFYNWPNDGQVSFSKTKDFSYMFYKLGNVNESAYYDIKYSSNMVNSIAKANPTNLDSMFELSNLQPYLKINTTGPVSTNSMFKNNGKRSYSDVSLEGNFLENSSDMTSFFEGSIITFSGAFRTATENFGKYTTSTKNMYRNSESSAIDFGKATFSVLEDTESMFEGYGGYYNSIRYLPNKSNISRLKRMKNMFKDLKVRSTNTLNMSSFNTEDVTDMSYLFGNSLDMYNQIETINLGDNFDTKNVTNMEGMFSNIRELRTLDLKDKFDTTKVTNMSKMFKSNSSLETLKIGNKFNTENVTDMNMMFASCGYLKDFDLSNFNTKKVTNMHAMFSGAYTLRKFINTSGFNTENVTDMSYMFNYTKFDKLDLSSFNTKNVTDMSYMFNDASNYDLTVTYPAVFDTSKVTNMAYMFNKSYVRYLPTAGFNTNKVTNMNHMFSESYINALSSTFNTASVTDMSFMFYKARNMQDSQVFNLNTRNVTNMESMFDQAFEQKPNQEAIFGVDFNTEKVTNVVNMFRAAKIRKADLTNFVGLPEVTSLVSFFDSVPVVDLIIPNPFNTSKVTTMERAFSGLTSLPSDYTLNLPLTTENVTDMTYMLSSCYAGNINLSSFNTQNVTIFKNMFENNKFKSLNIDNFNLEKAENINYMFASSQLLTELDLSHVKTTNALKSMYYTFYDMRKVVTISIPGFDTSGANNMYGAFYDMPELTTIYTSEKFVPPTAGATYYSPTERMFYLAPKLVGGAGTHQSNYHNYSTYARIDDPSNGKPGYFTYKAAP